MYEDNNYLAHYGVKGMKWRISKYKDRKEARKAKSEIENAFQQQFGVAPNVSVVSHPFKEPRKRKTNITGTASPDSMKVNKMPKNKIDTFVDEVSKRYGIAKEEIENFVAKYKKKKRPRSRSRVKNVTGKASAETMKKRRYAIGDYGGKVGSGTSLRR